LTDLPDIIGILDEATRETGRSAIAFPELRSGYLLPATRVRAENGVAST
jgi:hypothetical protein